ncbi:MAG TPA: choice-of-anchor Q domain-containing protein, partial [Solirubrobacteraceae bacterium]|nr:choice-of-anchor Q domain-containing protein [Solirubrobacteraceae bacterium]
GGTATAGDGRPAGDGGGLAAASAVTVRHTTFASNAASASGGAPGTSDGGNIGAGIPPGTAGSSLPGNTGPAGRGGGVFGGNVNLAATIVASNTPLNCSEGANLADDGGNNISFPETSCPGANADPRLAPLADNGGPTRTHALGADSAALDKVPASASTCQPVDQRGFGRPAGPACDIGAYELGLPLAATGAAVNVFGLSARVTGSVTPNRRTTTWFFEYGTTTGYGSVTPATNAGDGSGALDVGVDLGGLVPLTTYHYRLVARNADGTAFGADQTFTTLGPGFSPPPPRDTISPRFVSASLSPATFAVNPAGRAETAVPRAVAAQRRRVRRGTTFRYRLTEAARVVFAIQRARSGRRAGGRCRKPTRANRRRARCTRWVLVGRFAQQAAAGETRKAFSGRIGTKRLGRGRHRAVLVATDAAGNRSAARRLTFRIVRAR